MRVLRLLFARAALNVVARRAFRSFVSPLAFSRSPTPRFQSFMVVPMNFGTQTADDEYNNFHGRLRKASIQLNDAE